MKFVRIVVVLMMLFVTVTGRSADTHMASGFVAGSPVAADVDAAPRAWPLMLAGLALICFVAVRRKG